MSRSHLRTGVGISLLVAIASIPLICERHTEPVAEPIVGGSDLKVKYISPACIQVGKGPLQCSSYLLLYSSQ